MLPALAENAASCARFVREARTATRITDQHVARVLDVDTVDASRP